MVENQQCVICWLDRWVTVLQVFPEMGWTQRCIVLHAFVLHGDSETTPATERSNVRYGYTTLQSDISPLLQIGKA